MTPKIVIYVARETQTAVKTIIIQLVFCAIGLRVKCILFPKLFVTKVNYTLNALKSRVLKDTSMSVIVLHILRADNR